MSIVPVASCSLVVDVDDEAGDQLQERWEGGVGQADVEHEQGEELRPRPMKGPETERRAP